MSWILLSKGLCNNLYNELNEEAMKYSDQKMCNGLWCTKVLSASTNASAGFPPLSCLLFIFDSDGLISATWTECFRYLELMEGYNSRCKRLTVMIAIQLCAIWFYWKLFVTDRYLESSIILNPFCLRYLASIVVTPKVKEWKLCQKILHFFLHVSLFSECFLKNKSKLRTMHFLEYLFILVPPLFALIS